MNRRRNITFLNQHNCGVGLVCYPVVLQFVRIIEGKKRNENFFPTRVECKIIRVKT